MTSEPQPLPRMRDKKSDPITHIAGVCLVMFGQHMRQRCDWCGDILLEYDLEFVAVPDGTDPMPGSWPPGSLVRKDGNLSAVIEGREGSEEEGIQLPPDACAFDPLTWVGI